MTLHEFITMMLKSLAKFRAFYVAHKGDPAWPDEMSASDWLEQFMFFLEEK